MNDKIYTFHFQVLNITITMTMPRDEIVIIKDEFKHFGDQRKKRNLRIKIDLRMKYSRFKDGELKEIFEGKNILISLKNHCSCQRNCIRTSC